MSNLGLSFTPIQVSGDIITERLKLKNAQITVDDNDYSTINLSNFVGNTASFENINILGNGIVGGNLEVGGNLKVDFKLEPQVLVVPLATVQVLNAQSADLKEITSNNITNGNLMITNKIHSNIGNILTINATTINSSQINNTGTIYSLNGADIKGSLTVRNPNNPADYIQLRPDIDSFAIGGSNIIFDGQKNNYTATFDGFSQINMNDPVFLNQSTTTGENINSNSITLNDFTPTTKINKLYNINGELYFNNKKIQEANVVGNFVPIIQQVSNDISKYQTCVSYYLDFTTIGSNQTLNYYNQVPYPSFSDLPSLLYLSNAQSATTSLQLYNVSSQRTVGRLDGFTLKIFNNSAHKIAIYFSDKTNPSYNIWDGSAYITHIHIEADECIVFVYQQSFSQYFVVSRSVNLENYEIKLNNFQSVGTFTGTNANLSGYLYAGFGAIATTWTPNLATDTITPLSVMPGNIDVKNGNLRIADGFSVIYNNTSTFSANMLVPKS